MKSHYQQVINTSHMAMKPCVRANGIHYRYRRRM